MASTLRVGADIAQRLVGLASGGIKLAMGLPRDAEGRHLSIQLVRCSTSAGANYAEARSAESRADFVHKTSIAAKEARETSYWLAVIDRAGLLKQRIQPSLIAEAESLAAILAASARTARKKSA